MRRTRNLPLGLLAAALLAGCSGGPDLARVSGVVKLDGKPYPNAVVSFQPIGGGDMNPGKGSMGVTDANGRYELLYDGRTKGAVPGKHAVRISTMPGRGTDEPPPETGTPDGIIEPKGAKPNLEFDPIPMEWNEKSTKTYDVPAEGTDQANFDIVTGRKARR
ncbi:MAG TPA: hypothetical protein VFG68_04365 [Fimbriiglobus sp.]|nr:hypothetical protein [Fimbriiglobus sp.]